jgi:phosphoserine phosphatase
VTGPLTGPRRTERFASVVLDVDSTLTRLEGIDWLAERRGPDVAHAVAAMTQGAMEGTIALDSVYGERLALVRPTRSDVEALGDAYGAGVMPGARSAIDAMRAAGVRVVAVSGGVREAVVRFTASLGFADSDVHAVSLRFGRDGAYAGFDEASPLARRGGKPIVVRGLGLPHLIIGVGDGGTDAELKTAPDGGGRAVDAFAAFVGVAWREPVVAVADYVVHSLTELPGLVLGTAAPVER